MKIIDITKKIPNKNFHIKRNGYLVKGIVCHITGDSKPGVTLSWFLNPLSGVSSHYVIEKNGNIYMCVDPDNKAYHAGVVNSPTAKIYFDMKSVNPNLYTIGIECVSSGEVLTDLQYKNLQDLIVNLCGNFNIPHDRYHIIGHYETDSITRSFDPIKSYNMDKLVNDINFTKAINKLSNSPDYWNINCIAGKSINGEYLKNLILNFVAMFKTVSDFQSAINYLVSVKIISSPTYWITNCVSGKMCQGDYCRILIQNMGTKF